MPASLSDQNVLSGDPGFIGRVRAAMISTSLTIKLESPLTVPFHRERETYAVAVLNSPDTFKSTFANIVSGDAGVISDATAAGTVVLTGANVAAQAALVTDAHIAAAVNNSYNSLFRTPMA
jgi:hypothetical protein